MRRLIVNADDLGCSTLRDRGIFRAARKGIVTSASVLANGANFHPAVTKARAMGLPLGVHLNLADARPLCGPISGLTDEAGNFPGKAASRRVLLRGSCDAGAIRREISAQIERVFRSGIRPSHLDSHQHCFLYPFLTSLIIELCHEYHIDAMRLPLMAELRKCMDEFPSPLAAELRLYAELAPAASEALGKSGIRTPAGLFGMPLLNALDEFSLRQLLLGLPEGDWELMTHPGQFDARDPFGGVERERELQALCCVKIKDLAIERGIELIDFGALR